MKGTAETLVLFRYGLVLTHPFFRALLFSIAIFDRFTAHPRCLKIDKLEH